MVLILYKIIQLLFTYGTGSVRLSIQVQNDSFAVHIYEAQNLRPPVGNQSCNAYVKIARFDPGSQPGEVVETDVFKKTNNPIFNKTLYCKIWSHDAKKRLMISVLHEDSLSGQGILLGCFSFCIRDLLAKTKNCQAVEGLYCLLSMDVGSRKHMQVHQTMPVSSNNLNNNGSPEENNENCCGDEQFASRIPTGILTHQSGQSYSFMLQKKSSGFGFSIKGSKPVLVGKVKSGSSAENAGLKTGDSITAINQENVVDLDLKSVTDKIRLSSDVMTIEISRKPPHQVSWDENLIENDENTPLISNQSTTAANGSALNFVPPNNCIDKVIKAVMAKKPKRFKNSAFHCFNDLSNSVDSAQQPLISQQVSSVEVCRKADYTVFVKQNGVIRDNVYENTDKSIYISRKMYELKTAESRKRTLCRGVNDDLFDDTCSTTDVSRVDHNTAFIEPDSRNNNIDNRTFIWDPCMSVVSSAKSLPRPPTFDNLQTCSSDKDTSDDNLTLCPESPEVNRLNMPFSEKDSTCKNINFFPENSSVAESTQLCSKKSEKILARLVSIEETFVSTIMEGVQKFSRPLRHCTLTRSQHCVLFQNIEKLMVLSEFNLRSLKELIDSDASHCQNDKLAAICSLYASKISLAVDAYKQYLTGLQSSLELLQSLRKVPDFAAFISSTSDNEELTIEKFLQKPKKHLKGLATFLKLLLSCLPTLSDHYCQLHCVVEALTDVLQVGDSSELPKQDLQKMPSQAVQFKKARDCKTRTDDRQANLPVQHLKQIST